MSDFTIYHNPKCTKSRETLALLESSGHNPTIIEYLKTPLSPEQIKQLTLILQDPTESIVRTKEDEFKNSPFDTSNVDELTQRLSSQPKLMERPIVVRGDRAVICRPPEKVTSLY